MKFVIFALLGTFISLAVFGFFAMEFNGHEQSFSCWTATAHGAPCLTIDPFAIIVFHAQAFRMFGVATIVYFVLLVTFCVIFIVDLARIFPLRLVRHVHASMKFVPISIFCARRYFSLREHSPTV